MSTTSQDTKGRGQSEPSPRAPKRARTDTETSDKGPNGRSRHRITRACNECRRRKDRCGGQRPSCKSCIDNNRTCSYGPSKKRGLRPGYVRGIETLLGLIFKSIQGSEEWILGLLEGVIQQSSFCPASGLRDANISVDLLLETWHKSSVSKKMGSLLSTEGELDEEGAESSQIFDTKVVEGLALLISTKDSSGAPMTPMDTITTQTDLPTFDYSPLPITNDSPLGPRGGELFDTTVSRKQEPASRPPDSLSTAVPDLPKNWSYLLDLYFETTHFWFPISQKHELLRAAYTLSNESTTTSASSLSAGEMAFLQSVLAYASHQSTTLLKTPNRKSDVTNSLRSPQNLLETSLFANPTTFDLGHVRALLVICLFEIDQKHWSLAWTKIGRAIYTAISLGLVAQGTTIDPSSRDGLKRTMMGCTILETMVAARLDTLPYLTSSNFLLQNGLLADGNEEWEPCNLKILVEPEFQQGQQNTNSHVPGHVISTFNRSLQLILSLNDLIHHKKNLDPAGSFGKLIGLCKENFSAMGSLKATSLSPQALGLWIASVTIFEMAATVSNSPIVERPGGYSENVAWLAGITQKRVQGIGRCAISPVINACMELLASSLHHQEGYYASSNSGGDFHCAKEAIAKCLDALQESLRRTSQAYVSNDFEVIPAGSNCHSLLPLHIAVGKEPVSSRFELPPTPSTLLSSKVDTSVPGNAMHSQPPGGMSFPIDPALGSSIDDDGLFDSLATLDSTDWLANPPEFMQHLGMLDDAPSNLEHLFDMGF
ncbi:quinic acid utilization activator [Fusarium pseudoanthophilum]|uniref:Quinic acid utilization activator n=1 Tax=Fusarium pseudoanthophilum TaxID=48495 RepID=A0A8H5PWE1_9HYPO|nr:quinic acid utilization activator [Fusarium pseudoanthophilum]